MKRRRESLFFSLFAAAVLIGKLCGSELSATRGGQAVTVEPVPVGASVEVVPAALPDGDPAAKGEAQGDRPLTKAKPHSP